MSEDISIKVTIADVSFPLRIKPEEEDNLRHAAQLINDKLKSFREGYGVEDRQMLLSMVSLQLAAELLGLRNRLESTEKDLSAKLEEVHRLLDGFLQGA
jgi:cell division protein ZapA